MVDEARGGKTWWSRERLLAAVLLLGVLSGSIYLFLFTLPYPLARHVDTPFLDLGKITEYEWSANIQMVGGFAALFVMYYVGYRLCRRIQVSPVVMAVLFGFPALFSVILAYMYPISAADVFDYIVQSRIFAYYHANPYVATGGDYLADPFVPYMVWRDFPSVYGPVWTFLSAIPSIAGGESLLNSVLAFKALVSAFVLADGVLVYLVMRAVQPQWALAGAFAFTWNPLVLFETAGNAHNDAVMMFFVLLALYLGVKGKLCWVLPALVASIFVKFVTIVLVPVALVVLLKRSGSLRRALVVGSQSLALSGGLVALLWWPFWVGEKTLGFVGERVDFITASPGTLLFIVLDEYLPKAEAIDAVKTSATLALGVLVLWEVWLLWRGRRDLFSSSYQVVFLYLLVACLWFQPWYLVWLVALGALVPREGIFHRTNIFCFSAMLSYVVFYLWVKYPETFDYNNIQSLAVAVVYFAPVGYWWWSARAARPTAQRAGSPAPVGH